MLCAALSIGPELEIITYTNASSNIKQLSSHTMSHPTKTRHLHKKNKPHKPNRGLGTGMIILAWITLLGLLFAYFSDQQQQQFNPNSEPNTGYDGNKKSFTLKANRQNHFVMSGKINQQKVVLLLDTGATNVAISEKMATRLGLKKGRAGFAETANGSIQVFSTRINTLQLGNITLYDVAAEINPGMNSMDQVLLGMSALSQVEFSQRDGTLTITQ